MNHGLINKFFYLSKVSTDNDMFNVYPELDKLRRYFKEVNRRDRYYVAMKYHALKAAQRIYPEIVLEQMAEVINVTNHATVHYYLNKYIPLEGHREFISEHFDKFINNFIYPLTAYSEERKIYGLYKQTTLDEYRRKVDESATKKEKPKKIRQRHQAFKKDIKERY